MIINGMPKYARNLPYIVAREVNGEYWFYGAYDDEYMAEQVAYEIDGFIWDNPGISPRGIC